MGKLKDRPPAYAPLLELVFRRKREGGDVLAPAKFGGTPAASARKRCLVLVHGFNNNDGEAAVAYQGFRDRQVEAYRVTRDGLEQRFADAFWPGDADWGWFDLVDFGVYSNAVGKARLTAAEMRLLLLRMPGLLEVDFIGHSLGCRVIVETLELFRKHHDGPAIRRVCLMAPAIPMEMLEPGGPYHALLAQLSANGTRVLVLHSRQDKVLQFAFAAGQAMAGPNERSARALGREGPNPLMPGYHGTLDDVEMAGANHGDYWGHSGTGISRESARTAGSFLAIGTHRREVSAVRKTVAANPGYGWRRAFEGG